MSQPRCCICGDTSGVAFCDECQHYFCEWERSVWGVWRRGVAAVRQWLFDHPPAFCPGHAEEGADARGQRETA